jgi:copper oxidase (laccase) domain-containing protein
LGAFELWCSTRADGDFHRERVPLSELDARRRTAVDLPWTMLDEHHGVSVVRVERPGASDGARGDVAITDVADAVLGVWVGDCAPIALFGHDEFAVVHAGWRGLAGGVLAEAASAFTQPIRAAVLGPVIGACCYEFRTDDLQGVANGLGVAVDEIAGSTSDGSLALDMRAAVAAGLRTLGVADDALTTLGGCNGCGFPGFSHRVRRDAERHVMAVWRPRRRIA